SPPGPRYEIVTSLRVTAPPIALRSVSVTLKASVSGRPTGFRPYTCFRNRSSTSPRRCCCHCCAVVTRWPMLAISGSGRVSSAAEAAETQARASVRRVRRSIGGFFFATGGDRVSRNVSARELRQLPAAAVGAADDRRGFGSVFHGEFLRIPL